MHNLELAGAVVLVLAGVIMLVAEMVPKPLVPGQPIAAGQVIGYIWSSHELGLLHRLGARLMVSRYAVSDAEFEDAEQLMARAWLDDLYVYRAAVSRGEVLRPLLQVEELVERLESFSARVRRWRPGRAHGQG